MRFGNYAALLPAGLARRLARAFVGLVAAALAINGAINMWLSYEEATNAAVGVQREKALAAAERVGQFVGEIESQMGWTTRAEWARVSNDQRRYDFIRLLRQAPAVTEALFIDGMGREQLRLSRLEPDAVGSGADLSNDPRFLGAVADKVWYGPVYFRRGSEPYMTLSLAHAGRNPAVTSVGVNLKLIWDVIAALRVGEQGYAYVTDAAGRLIAHPDMSLVLRETDLSRLPQVTRAIAAARGEASWTSTEGVPGVDGRIVLSSAAVVPRLGWLVLVEMPRREVLAPVLTTLYQTLALLGLSIFFALLMGGFLARRMAEPIRQLQAGAERLGEGELSQRVAVTGHDEIGKLAERFNIMASRIQEAQETLERKVEDRTADLNDALERQTATADILKVIASSPTDVQPVFNAIAERSNRLIGGHATTVHRFIDDVVELVAFTPVNPEADAVLRSAFPQPISAFPHFELVRKGQHVQTPDTEAPEFRDTLLGEVARARGFRSRLLTPLIANNETIGDINVTRKEPGRFTDADIALMKTFADQAVIAIENVRLFNETQEALAQQTASAHVLSVISRSPSEVKPVLDAIVAKAAELCEAEFAYIARPDDGRMKLAAANNMDQDHMRWFEANPIVIDSGSITGRVAMSKETIHIEDVLAFPAFKRLDWQKVGQRHTVLGVPLLRNETLLGVIILARKEVRPFTDKQIRLVETFADQAVIAMENTRLFNETQESLQQQTASADILRVISQSVSDTKPVFDKILESCKHLFHGDETDVLLVDEQGMLQIAAYDGKARAVVEATFPAPWEKTPAAPAIRDRRVVNYADVLNNPDTPPVLRRMGKRLGYHSVAFAPMVWEDRGIGVVGVARSGAAFTTKELTILQGFADQAVIAIQNSRLFNETQEALEQQKASADVLEVISGSMADAQPVFDIIAERAATLGNAVITGVSRFDGEWVHLVAYKGVSEEANKAMLSAFPRRLDGSSISARAIRERAPVQIHDVALDASYGLKEEAARAGYHGNLAVPMIKDGTVVGAIVVCRAEAGPFPDKQIKLLQTFADQAVIAIENARLFEQVQARTSELQESLEYQTAITEVLGVISRSPSAAQPIFDTIVATAARLCRADQAFFMRFHGGAAHAVASSNDQSDLARYMLDNPVPLDPSTMTGRVVAEGRTVHLPDCLAEADYSATAHQRVAGYRTMLGVPLMREGTAIGSISLLRTRVEPFTDKQIALVETFADQAMIAIENARLFEEVQQRTRDLEKSLERQTATGEILASISGSMTDPKPVFDAIVRNLARLFDTRFAVLQLLRDGMILMPAVDGEPGFERITEYYPRPLDASTAGGQAMLERRVVHYAGLRDDPATPSGLRDYARDFGFDSVLFAPMLRGELVLGAIGFGQREAREFDADQVALINSFADQAVIAIENARLFEEVQAKTRELEASLADLTAAQTRLIQSEKLASLGQLTAGIAHEIKNPLNFVNNFADLSSELVGEIEEALASAGDQLDPKIKAEAEDVAAMLKGNLAKIVQHGRRADSIVKNMLAHSRESGGELRMVDVNATVEEALNLAYHGARAEKPGFNITLERDFDPAAGQMELYPQEFTRVLLNLIGNGFHAANKKCLDGAPDGFEPILRVTTKAYPDKIVIAVRDNGTGIPDAVRARIFEPFFTTKPTGEGTGLGLSLSHDIVVKQHGGKLDIVTEPGEFTEFTVTLPRAGISSEARR